MCLNLAEATSLGPSCSCEGVLRATCHPPASLLSRKRLLCTFSWTFLRFSSAMGPWRLGACFNHVVLIKEKIHVPLPFFVGVFAVVVPFCEAVFCIWLHVFWAKFMSRACCIESSAMDAFPLRIHPETHDMRVSRRCSMLRIRACLCVGCPTRSNFGFGFRHSPIASATTRSWW